MSGAVSRSLGQRRPPAARADEWGGGRPREAERGPWTARSPLPRARACLRVKDPWPQLLAPLAECLPSGFRSDLSSELAVLSLTSEAVWRFKGRTSCSV
ncbi:hypothetical protein NN561_006180 [Cricetulus griseus]